jgi:hypothetical protein
MAGVARRPRSLGCEARHARCVVDPLDPRPADGCVSPLRVRLARAPVGGGAHVRPRGHAACGVPAVGACADWTAFVRCADFVRRGYPAGCLDPARSETESRDLAEAVHEDLQASWSARVRDCPGDFGAGRPVACPDSDRHSRCCGGSKLGTALIASAKPRDTSAGVRCISTTKPDAQREPRPTCARRTAISFLTSAFGRGRSTGKCRELLVIA